MLRFSLRCLLVFVAFVAIGLVSYPLGGLTDHIWTFDKLFEAVLGLPQ